MNTEHSDLIYLLSCAVNSVSPDKKRAEAMDLDKLYDLCKWHTIRGTVFTALNSAGIQHEGFSAAYNNAVRKNIILDSEREAITAEMEKQGIWYLPLKGAVLKELYPKMGMREMSDNDILYDKKRQNDLKEIMLARGYTAESVGKSYTDEYKKPPVLNMEMHTSLFLYGQNEKFFRYYEDMSRLMKPDEDSKYGRHFTDEDFYVYMTAHEYRHHNGGGTGIRSLVDCYVFMKAMEGKLDRGYIEEQLNQLGIADYEKERLALSMKLFSSAEEPVLTDDEEAELEKYLAFGTYGTVDNVGTNSVRKYIEKSGNKSKAGFIRARLFPDLEFMKHHYPFFYKTKVLLPVGYVWRWIKGIFTRPEKLRAEIKALKKYDNKKL